MLGGRKTVICEFLGTGMIPNHIFQNDGSYVMTAALVLVRSVRGADEEILPLFKIVGDGIIELLSAIGTEHQTRKRTALARFSSFSLHFITKPPFSHIENSGSLTV